MVKVPPSPLPPPPSPLPPPPSPPRLPGHKYMKYMAKWSRKLIFATSFDQGLTLTQMKVIQQYFVILLCAIKFVLRPLRDERVNIWLLRHKIFFQEPRLG